MIICNVTTFVYSKLAIKTSFPHCGSRLSHFHNRDSLGGLVGCAIPTGDQEVAVQPQLRSATFFRGDWSWNIFYGHSLPSSDSRKAVVSFWWKSVHKILVNRLEDYACPVNMWLGKLTVLNMTPLGWLGRKTSAQTQQRDFCCRMISRW